ncbi:MAG: hypothetical protein GEU83_04950 [Pseudonocardiaceae bacterium]|nr:hypothetical protein [Pseudonocardiaceae bacterium]
MAFALAVVGVVMSVATVVTEAGAGEPLIFLAFLAAPLVLTGVPLAVRGPANGAAALTVACAVVLVTYTS